MGRFYGSVSGPYGGRHLGGSFAGGGSSPLTYEQIVLEDSPSSYWRLDEVAGAVAGDAVGANDGTLVNTPTLGAASLVTGGAGAMLVALANSEDITLPGPVLSTNGTFEMWFKWTAGITIVRDHTSAGGTGFMAYDSGGNFAVRVSGTDIPTSKVPATQVRDGVKHHFVVTKSGANVVIYFDNEVIGSSASAGSTATTMPWHLGKNGAAVAYVDCTYDEVAIYPTALSAARVAAHYAAGI